MVKERQELPFQNYFYKNIIITYSQAPARVVTQ
jgi:hypothetical protein